MANKDKNRKEKKKKVTAISDGVINVEDAKPKKEKGVSFVIFPCKCIHKFQDSKYGPGRRVMNTMKPETLKARCTVCGTEHVVFRSKQIKEKK